MKNERRAKIIELIGQYPIETQEELAERLEKSGFSRDAGKPYRVISES